METSDSVPKWFWIAASAVGSSHEKLDLPCQDAFCILACGEYLFIAVADGAGSAVRSKDGADLATQAAIRELQRLYEGSMVPTPLSAVISARNSVLAFGQSEGIEARELACTLIVVVASSTDISVAHLGDGAVVLRSDDGWLTLSVPQNGEYANDTVFLTSDFADDLVQLNTLATSKPEIAVFTDGVQPVALTGDATPFAPFFESLSCFSKGLQDVSEGNDELARLLCSQRLRERTDDDVTLVFARLLTEESDE